MNQNPINEYDPEGLRPVTPAGSSSHDLLRTNGRGGLTNRVPESPTPATSTTLSKPDGLSPSDAFRQGIKTAAIGAALAASVYALEAMVARLVALGTYGSCVNFAQSTGLLRAGQAIIPQIQNGVLNIVIHGRQLTPAVVEALSSYILMMKKVHKIQKARLLTCGGAAAAAEMEAATGVAVWGTEKDVWVWVITFVSPF